MASNSLEPRKSPSMDAASTQVSFPAGLRGSPNTGLDAPPRSLSGQQGQEGSHAQALASDRRNRSAPSGCGYGCAAGRGHHVDGAGEPPSHSRQDDSGRASRHGLLTPARLPPGRGVRMEEGLQALVARPGAHGVIVRARPRISAAARPSCAAAALPGPLARRRVAAVSAVHWRDRNFRSRHLIQSTGGHRWRGQ
jgi:hypothetical protein